MAQDIKVLIKLLLEDKQFKKTAGQTKKQLGGIQSALGDVAKNVASAFGIPTNLPQLITSIILGFKDAIQTTIEFRAKIAESAAVTGQSLEELGGIAREAAVKTTFTALQAADAITELGRAGVKTAEDIRNTLPAALQLAELGNIKTGRAAQILANSVRQLGLDFSDSSALVSSFVVGANSAATNVGELTRAFERASGVASQAGQSYKTINTLLLTFADAGLRGTRAGRALSTTLGNLLNPSKRAQRALKKFNISANDIKKNINDPLKLIQLLKPALNDTSASFDILGKNFVQVAKIANLPIERIEELQKAAAGSVSELNRLRAIEYSTTATQIKLLGSAFQEIQLKIAGDSGVEAAVKDVVITAREFINEIGELAKEVGIFDALGAVVQGVVAGLKIGFLAFKQLTRLLAVGLSPITDKLRVGFQKLRDVFVFISAAINEIDGLIGDLANSLKKFIRTGAAGEIIKAFEKVVNWFHNRFLDIQLVVSDVVGFMKTAFTGAIGFVTAPFVAIASVIQRVANKAIKGLVTFTSKAFKTVIAQVRKFAQLIQNLPGGKRLASGLNSALATADKAFTKLNKEVGSFSAGAKTLFAGASKAVDEFAKKVKARAEGIKKIQEKEREALKKGLEMQGALDDAASKARVNKKKKTSKKLTKEEKKLQSEINEIRQTDQTFFDENAEITIQKNVEFYARLTELNNQFLEDKKFNEEQFVQRQDELNAQYVANNKKAQEKFTKDFGLSAQARIESLQNEAKMATGAFKNVQGSLEQTLEAWVESGKISSREFFKIFIGNALDGFAAYLTQLAALTFAAGFSVAGGPINFVNAGIIGAAAAGIKASKAAILASFQDGGVVGGFRGATSGPDNTMINARVGEGVINATQQRRLFDIANGAAPDSGKNISVNINGNLELPGVNNAQEFLEEIVQIGESMGGKSILSGF